MQLGKEFEMSDMSTMQGDDQPVFDLLAEMTAASLERSTLDPQSLMYVRLAALVAVEAPPMSYLANLSVASELGVTAEQVEGILMAIAPIVGTTRIVAAAGGIARALGMAIAVSEEEIEAEA
jgi:alkylhydroperoxidase/carboxymuconolactone decarboxylase family protein YurZ